MRKFVAKPAESPSRALDVPNAPGATGSSFASATHAHNPIQHTGGQAASATQAPMCRGFTLVELMVVIGIMAILVAIVLPAANALLASSRANSTRANMQVLENAISCYETENTLKDDVINPLCDVSGSSVYYKNLFGPYPPSPTSEFASKPSQLSICLPSNEDEPASIALTTEKLLRLVKIYIGKDEQAGASITDYWKKQPPAATLSNLESSSIECLLLFLSTQSTQARQIIDQLPDSARVNLDQDYIFEDTDSNGDLSRNANAQPTEQYDELFEVVDAWKNPLRYAVKYPIYDSTTGNLAFPAIWELRSAGPDGIFSAPWTNEDQSDDVILRSQ